MRRGLLFVILGVSLLACESSVNPPPPDKPTVSISGSSSVMGGDLAVSTFSGADGELLASSTTSNSGSFEVSIKTGSGPIKICISNGVYFEAAASETVPMAVGKLCSVVNYEMGVAIDASINYYSHLAYALASHLVSQGRPATESVLDANNRVNKLLGVDVSKIHALDMTNEANSTLFATDRHLFGIAVAGLSALTGDTATFSQVMFEDLVSDGLLDGVGDNSTPLSAGNVTQIGTETYRHDLAVAIYNSVNSDFNKTGLDGSAIKEMLDILNLSNDPMFGGAGVVSFDGKPTIITSLDTTIQYTGEATYTFDIGDNYSVSDVTITLNGQPVAFVENSGIYTATIDTTIYGDGIYPLTVTATNIYGNETVSTSNIEIFNTSASSLNGTAFDGLIIDGNLTVYNFSDGTKGQELANTVTDIEGRYTVEILAHSTPILIEVTGGRYVEEASGRSVPLQITSDHILRAVAIHEPGVTIDVSVTTWTNIAAGLAEYRISQGLDVSTAIIGANFDVNNVVGLNTLTTTPLDITNINNAAAINDELRYGFIAGGASQFTYDSSLAAQESPVHDVINSINLTVLAYEDIRSNGLLDGQGSVGELQFANKAIDANTYRHSIGLGIIRMARNSRNQSGLTPLMLLPTAKQINDSTNSIFGSLPTIAIDENGPMVNQFLPLSSIYNKGTISVSASVSDLLGVTQVELLVNGISFGLSNDLNNINYSVDSFTLDDCVCDFTVRATNIAGSTTNTSNAVQIDNRRFMYFYHYPNSPTPITNLTPVSVSPINGRIHSYDTTAGSSLFMGNTSLLPLTMHPSNQFGYFFDNSTFDLVKYDLDPSTGSPANRVVLEAGINVNSVGRGYHFSKDGRFLFKLRDERVRQDGVNFVSTVTPSSISSYSVASDGTLTYLSKIDVPHGPIMMANNPILDVVYVPQWEADSIGIYKIQQNGSLIPLPGAPAITGNSPRYIAVDAAGKYAYIAFGLENVIKKYRFSPEGWLIFETSYATGATPRTIQIHSDGSLMYVANFDGTLNIFNINQTNGQLTPTVVSPLTISASGMRGMYLDAASEYAIFWGSFGAMIAPVNIVDGSIGARTSLFNANGQPVLPPMLTRGTANAQP